MSDWADIETEVRVVGTVLNSPGTIGAMVDEVSANEFTTPMFATIFQAAADLHTAGHPIDAVSVGEKAGSTDVTMACYNIMLKYGHIATNATHHAKVVRGYARKRHLRDLGEACIETAAGAEWHEADSAYVKAADGIMRHAGKEQGDEWMPLKDATIDAMTQVEERYWNLKNGVTPTWCLTMGLASLDDLAQGYQDGHLHIIGANSGHGKTAFGVWSTSAAAEASGRLTLYLTLEVDTRDTVFRLMASKARVNSRNIREGSLSDGDIDRLTRATGAMKVSNHMLLCYKPGATIEWLSQSTRRLKRAGVNIGCVVVDYIQKLRSEEKFFSPEQRIAHIAESLKDLAGTLDVPMVGLVQLNRDSKGRPSKEPVVSDIRGSSVVEHEASLIAFLHRPEMCGDESPQVKGLCKYIVRKGRNFGPGTVDLRFVPEHGRFEDWRGGYE